MQRKGVVHVIEAIIATFLLLSFLLFMTQPADRTDVEATLTHKTMFQTLQALDTAGELRGPAYQQDLDTIKDLVQNHTNNRAIEIALLTLNTTSQEAAFTSTHEINVTVRNTTERQILRVWYRDAAAPNVSVNDQFIANNTGTLTDEYEAYDIVEHTTTGENTVTVDVSGSSRIGYSIDIYDREQSAEPPAARSVFTTSYPVSGVNTSFFPVEVTILSWQ